LGLHEKRFFGGKPGHYCSLFPGYFALFLPMFSKQEASKLRQEFWTIFGQYMAPVFSAEQEKINWINYKTGVKDFSFRMKADNKSASIAIELSHNDPEIQQICFEQLQQFKSLFEITLNEQWNWELHSHSETGKPVSRVIKHIEGFNIYKKEDWPDLISFFKRRMIAIDAFWSQVKYGFEI
jgi:hypothetical protein